MSTTRSDSCSDHHRQPVRAAGALAAGALTVLMTMGASLASASAMPVAGGEALKGLFKLDPASCASGAAKGSYFRMIQPGGGPNGPFIENNTSACGDKTYTDLAPGRDGGLSTMGYQPQPDPPFDAGGGGTNDKITMPKEFFGAKFATASNPKDPQTGTDTPAPSIVHDGKGKLSGDLRSFAAAYQRQHFNQGSPKPDGSTPGLTGGPSGTYDAASKRFSIEWTSTIVGGPFNNFTGKWHLEGVFQPGVAPASASAAGAPSVPLEGPSGLPTPIPAVGTEKSPGRLNAAAAGGEQLKGLFRLTAASCATAEVSGTYFRMIQPGGSAASGPFLSNNSSACADKTYTELTPGKDGGLSTTAYQPQPDPPFDSAGGGANDKITMPKEFFGAKFATATNPKDPQMNLTAALPVVTHDGKGKLSGDLRAFAAAYQSQHFNQGAPKPDGSTPGATTLPSGTYDAATKKFSLEWASTIVGGPFNNFTGKWHFEGTFEPVAGATPVTTVTTAPAGGTTPTSGTSGSATAGGAGASRATTTGAAAPAASPGSAIASTGLRTSLRLPFTLIALGLISLALGRATRPAGRRPAPAGGRP